MNTIFILFFIFVVSGIAYFLYLKVNPSKSSNIKELYSEGLDMLVSGKRLSAYNNFKEIIEKDSNNVMAYLRLGQILRENGNNIKAIKVHKNLLLRKKLSSYELIELHKNLSQDYYNMDNKKESIAECIKILSIDKKNDWAIRQIVKLYKENDDWINAEKYLNVYYDEYPDKKNKSKIALYKVHQAKNEIKNKDFSQARQYLDDAIKLDNENSIIYFFMAKSYSEESNLIYEKSQEVETQGLDKYDNQESYNNFIKEAKELLAKAVPLWAHFCEISPNKSWLVLPLLKDALFALDRYSELELMLIKLNEKFPENIEILISLADYYSHKGEFDKSLEMIEIAIEKDNKSYLAHLIKIKLQLENENNNNQTKTLEFLINSLMKNQRFQMLNTSVDHEEIKSLFDIDE